MLPPPASQSSAQHIPWTVAFVPVGGRSIWRLASKCLGQQLRVRRCRRAERLAAGRMRRPMLLRHVGQHLRHLVVADAQLTDLAALCGAMGRRHIQGTAARGAIALGLSDGACNHVWREMWRHMMQNAMSTSMVASA
jgi:hypothetical protein